MNSQNTIAVVGGHISSLACAVTLADAGLAVALYSPRPVERYAPTTTEGINAAIDSHSDGDSPKVHFEETMAASGGKAYADFAMRMCESAPEILNLLVKLGVPFTRSINGKLDFRVEPPSEYHRAAYVWNETGRHIHRILCDQVRRCEASAGIARKEYTEVLDIIPDGGGICRGLVTLDLKSMEVAARAYDAVVLAVGAPLAAYSGDMALRDDFAPMISAYIQGARWVNPHAFLFHPPPIRHSGGLMVDAKFQTDIGRLFATGECACVGKAEGMLPGNELLRDIFGGMRCASFVKEFFIVNQQPQIKPDAELFEMYRRNAEEKLYDIEPPPGDIIDDPSTDKTAAGIHNEIAGLMNRTAGPNRTRESLEEAKTILSGNILPRFTAFRPTDPLRYANRDIPFAHRLRMLIIACEAIIRSAMAELSGDIECCLHYNNH